MTAVLVSAFSPDCEEALRNFAVQKVRFRERAMMKTLGITETRSVLSESPFVFKMEISVSGLARKTFADKEDDFLKGMERLLFLYFEERKIGASEYALEFEHGQ